MSRKRNIVQIPCRCYQQEKNSPEKTDYGPALGRPLFRSSKAIVVGGEQAIQECSLLTNTTLRKLQHNLGIIAGVSLDVKALFLVREG